ncbi:hypothetical protein CDG60_07565 [Acinetobacter chinensis]|jgi:hypothetical protein|uniref:Uncharacterized protein n=1 Tax=Acinetobacter chinensis TaxID=2004650 RepID=A0A3B7LVM1_9GAMM|nr:MULTISPECIES: hypothetical protein [Acinetobacter]AXY56441.1 hypothetical protein CDG60_07565 [Acinetobacter chinensis]AXY59830.1 hypothetical protein CDG61_07185 [Acinetobacter sp. WCHAc010052]MDV2468112.1 hypothetical protein [Acinetobacter chinensis]WOE42863.1 hypothetical protein QSG87_06995 [Acinetobacter chinensis]
MEVIGYLHNADLILEGEQGMAIIGGSSYVLSLGDKVMIRQCIDQDAHIYQVQISFAGAEHSMLHDDEILIKFEGCKDKLQQYIQASTVH